MPGQVTASRLHRSARVDQGPWRQHRGPRSSTSGSRAAANRPESVALSARPSWPSAATAARRDAGDQRVTSQYQQNLSSLIHPPQTTKRLGRPCYECGRIPAYHWSVLSRMDVASSARPNRPSAWAAEQRTLEDTCSRQPNTNRSAAISPSDNPSRSRFLARIFWNPSANFGSSSISNNSKATLSANQAVQETKRRRGEA